MLFYRYIYERDAPVETRFNHLVEFTKPQNNCFLIMPYDKEGEQLFKPVCDYVN
jgi:hypothetical protein